MRARVLILFAVELCIMLGLHRKDTSSGIGLGSELDKRLFWAVYSLDRHASISMGRPPAISDHDIDVLVSNLFRARRPECYCVSEP